MNREIIDKIEELEQRIRGLERRNINDDVELESECMAMGEGRHRGMPNDELPRTINLIMAHIRCLRNADKSSGKLIEKILDYFHLEKKDVPPVPGGLIIVKKEKKS
jgi:hypothetical protein